MTRTTSPDDLRKAETADLRMTRPLHLKALSFGGKYGTIVVLVGISLIFFILAPTTFGSPSNLLAVLTNLAPGAIVALGLTVCLIGGDFDLSVGYQASIAGVFVVGLLSGFGLVGVSSDGLGGTDGVPLPLAILAVLGVGMLFGLVNGFVVTKLGVNALIATLGTGTVIFAVNLLYGNGVTYAVQDDGAFAQLALGKLFGVIPYPIIVLIVFSSACGCIVNMTPLGQHIKAVGDDPEAARRLGINVDRTRTWSFIICGFCGTAGGIMLAASLGSADCQRRGRLPSAGIRRGVPGIRRPPRRRVPHHRDAARLPDRGCRFQRPGDLQRPAVHSVPVRGRPAHRGGGAEQPQQEVRVGPVNAKEDTVTSTGTQADTMLEASGIHKWFGGLHALDDVSFSIRRGEAVGLVGDNGAGKSTLLKTISGVHQPTEGDSRARGTGGHARQPFDRAEARRRDRLSGPRSHRPVHDRRELLPGEGAPPIRDAAQARHAPGDRRCTRASRRARPLRQPQGLEDVRRTAPGGGDRARRLLGAKHAAAGRADGRSRRARVGRGPAPARRAEGQRTDHGARDAQHRPPLAGSATASWCCVAVASSPTSTSRRSRRPRWSPTSRVPPRRPSPRRRPPRRNAPRRPRPRQGATATSIADRQDRSEAERRRSDVRLRRHRQQEPAVVAVALRRRRRGGRPQRDHAGAHDGRARASRDRAASSSSLPCSRATCPARRSATGGRSSWPRARCPATPTTPSEWTGFEEYMMSSAHVGCHVDGLAHNGIAGRGYNGIHYSEFLARDGLTRLGAENMRPWVTRGVCLDIAAVRGVDMLGAGRHDHSRRRRGRPCAPGRRGRRRRRGAAAHRLDVALAGRQRPIPRRASRAPDGMSRTG